jgi:hypothetical protein
LSRNTEIPIWLTPADVDALEVEHGVRLLPQGQNVLTSPTSTRVWHASANAGITIVFEVL